MSSGGDGLRVDNDGDDFVDAGAVLVVSLQLEIGGYVVRI